MDTTEFESILSLLEKPAFLAKGDTISTTNKLAAAMGFLPGQEVYSYFLTGHEEYADLSEGTLSLSLMLGDNIVNASVLSYGESKLFILEREELEPELQAMSLVAMQMRKPMTTLAASAEAISAMEISDAAKQQLAKLNQSIYQLLRMVGNMSDIARYRTGKIDHRSCQNAPKVIGEIFDKASALLSHAETEIHFQNLKENVYCLIDTEKLERGIYNILSNAVKASPKGSPIYATLTKQGKLLRLTVENTGTISEEAMRNVYSRYSREPSFLDGNAGIGFGMALVQQAAKAHNGTVLLVKRENTIRTTMTISLAVPTSSTVRSPILTVDYSGERDHARVELSDVLPSFLYE